MRYNFVTVGKVNLLLGSRIGYLIFSKSTDIPAKGNLTQRLILQGGLLINPFVSAEIPINPSNNLVISAGYRSQFYKLYTSGQNVQTLFNDDFEYLNFSIGISF